MDQASELSCSVSDSSRNIAPEILGKLKHLDLSGHVAFSENRVINGGAYGDVSTAIYNHEERGLTRVAVKRLRFYLSDDIKLVSGVAEFLHCQTLTDSTSCSRKKYTCGLD